MGLTQFQWVLLVLFVLGCINYLTLVGASHLIKAPIPDEKEGFSDVANADAYTWKTDTLQIYDSFYSKVYDQLVQLAPTTQSKVALCINTWKKRDPNLKSWVVLDAGCGTGLASQSFAQMDVGRVIAIDNSPSMLRQAKEVALPASKLTKEQQQSIEWRQDNLLNASACAPGELSHAVVFYFTIYYLRDMEGFFRNLNVWTRPGGQIAVEVVNKYKFDPLLESASPFVGFSLQKYADKRLTKSKVAFDKFDYEAEFHLEDPNAEFRETFRFKDGTVRRQKHMFVMPAIEKIVKTATLTGWTYVGFIDLTTVGFEYGYLLQFSKA